MNLYRFTLVALFATALIVSGVEAVTEKEVNIKIKNIIEERHGKNTYNN